MLTIRQQRVGKKNRPHFRVVLVDSKKAPKSGAFLEILGWRDPIKKEVKLKKERIKHWMSEGAQLSDAVHNLLVSADIVQGAKRAVHATKPSKKKSGAPAEGEEEKSAEKKVAEKEVPATAAAPEAVPVEGGKKVIESGAKTDTVEVGKSDPIKDGQKPESPVLAEGKTEEIKARADDRKEDGETESLTESGDKK